MQPSSADPADEPQGSRLTLSVLEKQRKVAPAPDDDGTPRKNSGTFQLPAIAASTTKRASQTWLNAKNVLENANASHGRNLKHRSRVPFLMISPTSQTRLAWELGVIAPLVIYLVAALPFTMCFQNKARGGLAVFNIVIDLIFLSDMILIFRTGLIVDSLSREQDYDPWHIARRYICGWFFVDFLSSIPFGILDLKVFDSNSGVQALKDISVIRMMKMLRFLKLAKLLKGAHILNDLDQDQVDMVQDFLAHKATKTTLRLSNILLKLVFLVHIMACLWVAVARASLARGLDSWLEHDFEEYVAEDTTRGDDVGSIYVSAFYFCLTTMTTVGFGDVQPRNDSERGFVICLEVVGGLFYAYIVGSLTAIITKGDPNSQKAEEKLGAVSSYIDKVGLTISLGRRIRRFYRAHFDKRAAVDERAILEGLTLHLQTEVAHFLAEVDLKCAETVVFRLMPPPLWTEFLPLLRPCLFERGEVVCMQGDYCAEALLVTEGAFTGATDLRGGDWLKLVGVDLEVQAQDDGSIHKEAFEIEEWQQKLEEKEVEKELRRRKSRRNRDAAGSFRVSPVNSGTNRTRRRSSNKSPLSPTSPASGGSLSSTDGRGASSSPTSSAESIDESARTRTLEDVQKSKCLLREEHEELHRIASLSAMIRPDETKDDLRVRLSSLSQTSVQNLLKGASADPAAADHDVHLAAHQTDAKDAKFKEDDMLHLRIITNGQVVNILGLYRIWHRCLESVKAAGPVECLVINNRAFARLFGHADDAPIFEAMQERIATTQYEMMPDPSGAYGAPTKWGVPVHRLSAAKISRKEADFVKSQGDALKARKQTLVEYKLKKCAQRIFACDPFSESKTPTCDAEMKATSTDRIGVSADADEIMTTTPVEWGSRGHGR